MSKLTPQQEKNHAAGYHALCKHIRQEIERTKQAARRTPSGTVTAGLIVIIWIIMISLMILCQSCSQRIYDHKTWNPQGNLIESIHYGQTDIATDTQAEQIDITIDPNGVKSLQIQRPQKNEDSIKAITPSLIIETKPNTGE